jgi:hypothetical protein
VVQLARLVASRSATGGTDDSADGDTTTDDDDVGGEAAGLLDLGGDTPFLKGGDYQRGSPSNLKEDESSTFDDTVDSVNSALDGSMAEASAAAKSLALPALVESNNEVDDDGDDAANADVSQAAAATTAKPDAEEAPAPAAAGGGGGGGGGLGDSEDGFVMVDTPDDTIKGRPLEVGGGGVRACGRAWRGCNQVVFAHAHSLTHSLTHANTRTRTHTHTYTHLPARMHAT